MSLAERVEIELRLRPSAARPPESATQRSLVQKPGERSGERLWIAWRDQETGFAVHDELTDTADLRCHDRQSRSHGFDHRDRQTFRLAREDEYRGPSEQVGHVVASSPQDHAVAEAESINEGLHGHGQIVQPLEIEPVR